MNRQNVPAKNAIGVSVLGVVVFVAGALSFIAPYRDEASATGAPALLGIPVWVMGLFGMGLGVFVVLVGLYYLGRTRR